MLFVAFNLEGLKQYMVAKSRIIQMGKSITMQMQPRSVEYVEREERLWYEYVGRFLFGVVTYVYFLIFMVTKI